MAELHEWHYKKNKRCNFFFDMSDEQMNIWKITQFDQINPSSGVVSFLCETVNCWKITYQTEKYIQYLTRIERESFLSNQWIY